MNFQAAVTAIVEVHIAVGAKLDWLVGVAHDVPVVVRAETGGSGDDIGLQFGDDTRTEVQVKRGLSADSKMWEAVMKLAKAVNDGAVDYGVLVVSPDSSGTVKYDLARDLERLAGGRSDGLKSVTNKFVKKLEDADLSVDKVSRGLRIVTLNCLVSDDDAIRAAKAWLGNICSNAAETDRAWNALYLDGHQLIELRGARAADSVVQLLRSEGIALKTESQAPSPLLDSLCSWTFRTTSSFSIPGILKPLPIVDAWIELDALVVSEGRETPTGLAEALEHYHSWAQGGCRRAEKLVKAETLGRFIRRSVLVGGPGMGKSTLLKKLALIYAAEGFPVIHFEAKFLAQRMRSIGCSFEEGIVALGTDGSGLPISVQTLRAASKWVLLCDALDEAGSDQEIVCEGLLKFAAGYPESRIVVMTRPIGYSSGLLGAWRHYQLQPLESVTVVAHIERLVRIVIRDPNAQESAVAFAKAQIDRNENARIAARSPLILGLVSALAIQRVPLGVTKTQLYERLFSQMEVARSGPSVDGGLSSTILSSFLDILAWEILRAPAARVADLYARCGAYLAEALSEPKLKARAMAEKCFAHWERVGMVEKVNHAGVEAATFIHKTFGEYAAARHLANMPKGEARKELDAKIDEKAWSEVLVFASSLGLADAVLESRIGTKDNLTYKAVAEALSIIANSEVSPAAWLRKKAFDAATQYLRSPIAWEAISIGNRLIDLGDQFPQEVADVGVTLIDSDQAWTRLAGWAAMTFAQSDSYDLAELKMLVAELPALSATVSDQPFRHGINLSANPSKQIDVLYAFAVRETLKRLPAEEAGTLLIPLLTPSYHESLGRQRELLRIVHEHHRSDLAELLERPLKDPLKEQWERMAGLLSDSSKATFVLVNALKLQLPALDSGELLKEGTTLWQLSGFMGAISPLYDTWPAQVEPEDTAVQETLRGCIIASVVDPTILSKEVASVLKAHSGLNDDQFSSLLYEHFMDVDIEMEWQRAKGMDLLKLEHALHYSTDWIVESAANLIAVNATPDDLASLVERVFETGQGNALWAASQFCLLLEEPTKSRLFFERLEKPLQPGCQHLYSALAQLPLPLDERLLRILRIGLLTYGPLTATAAVEVAENYVDRNKEVARLLQESFDQWCSKEDPYPEDGRIPDSPREQILKALLKSNDFDKLRLLRYVTDVRSDVKMVASEALFQALKAGALRYEFLAGIDRGELPPSLLARALKQRVPFTESQAHTICGFLSRPSTEHRRAAMLIVQNEYLPTAEVQERAKVLLNDPDPEIRERARRLLSEGG